MAKLNRKKRKTKKYALMEKKRLLILASGDELIDRWERSQSLKGRRVMSETGFFRFLRTQKSESVSHLINFSSIN